MVKAVIYELIVVEGAMDFIHGGGHLHKEIYIPSQDIVLSVDNGNLYVFAGAKEMNRHDNATIVSEIDLNESDVEFAKKYTKMQKRLKEVVKANIP